jgi:hypothetical protein
VTQDAGTNANPNADAGAGADAATGENGKPWIALFCAGLLAFVIAPVAQNWMPHPVDGFPFSYYPMFAERVGETYRVTHVVGIDGAGREHVIPFGYLGVGGLNEVRVHVQREARHDPQRFCQRVATALNERATGELRDVQQLVIRTGRYLLDSFYAGRIEPRSMREHARCPVR